MEPKKEEPKKGEGNRGTKMPHQEYRRRDKLKRVY